MSTTENIYLPKSAIIDRVTDNIQDVKTFYWRFEDPAEQAAFKKFKPGQFAQVSLFGIGEFPLSLPPRRCTSSRLETSLPFAVLTATASRWRITTARTWCSWPAVSV
jgi:NAD(P)H-flavin reductase